ncbi:hypothetical protein AB1Y20_020132 [Prymnesium parvum]|uniref:Peptidase M23 domain-containing protein n=1 Tax=Prymnesium parvum TaxID=97485 RepID=A0AB34JWI4_PRYPA
MRGVHVHPPSAAASEWVLRRRRSDRRAYGRAPPDMLLDPRSGVLSFLNRSDEEKAFFVSVRTLRCVGAAAVPLSRGAWRRGGGASQVTTLVVRVGPGEAIDVCKLQGARRLRSSHIYSDIVDLPRAIAPHAHGVPPPVVLGFPLAAGRPFLCSQAEGGRMTHFAHPSTFHAIDLDAPVGTDVLAVEGGTVLSVQQERRTRATPCCTEHRVIARAPPMPPQDARDGGIDCSLFFQFNCLVLLLDRRSEDEAAEDIVVEYVHIRADSACVAAGDKVLKGQKLCESGDVGFCPTPHLHIEAHRTPHGQPPAKAAPSVPIAFERAIGDPYSPREGCYYEAERGLVGNDSPLFPMCLGKQERMRCSDTDSPAACDANSGDSDSNDDSGWETISGEDEL